MVEVVSCCPICEKRATVQEGDTFVIKCSICGRFNLGYPNPSFTEEEKIKLRYFYYILPTEDERRLETITKSNKEEIISQIISPKTILEKMNNIILYVANNTKYFGEPVLLDTENSYREFFCKDKDEFINILNTIKAKGYITIRDISIYDAVGPEQKIPHLQITITGEGLEFAEKFFNNIDSKQCFVAMWFDDSTNELFKIILNAVTGNPSLDKENENYGANYTIMRIDDKHHTNYIPAEIISEIKRSRFMIADLTGYRGGVYYEAGYAEGLGIPVILTCHENWFNDQIDENNNLRENGVHFDLKQKNILFWTEDTLATFQKNLVARIGEVVGFNK